jgi:hypothetical protein
VRALRVVGSVDEPGRRASRRASPADAAYLKFSKSMRSSTDEPLRE